MEIYERIFSLLGKEKSRQVELSKAIGVSNKTISAWKTRGSDPSAKLISAIADFFHVSVEYILTGKASPSSGSGLSDDQEELLSVYDSLDLEGKAIVKSACYSERRRMKSDADHQERRA